jgi:hypothetical protein
MLGQRVVFAVVCPPQKLFTRYLPRIVKGAGLKD